MLYASPSFNHNSFDAKFFSLGEGRYGVQKKGESAIDDITGVSRLQFQDQALSLANDIAATFNQVKGMDDVSGVVFRLYNAAFARFQMPKGLRTGLTATAWWTYATSAQEFSSSQEFKIGMVQTQPIRNTSLPSTTMFWSDHLMLRVLLTTKTCLPTAKPWGAVARLLRVPRKPSSLYQGHWLELTNRNRQQPSTTRSSALAALAGCPAPDDRITGAMNPAWRAEQSGYQPNR